MPRSVLLVRWSGDAGRSSEVSWGVDWGWAMSTNANQPAVCVIQAGGKTIAAARIVYELRESGLITAVRRCLPKQESRLSTD